MTSANPSTSYINPAGVGAGFLAEAIKRQGVRTVFGICGHLDLFFGALQDVGIRIVDMRHESAVVHATDAYARTTGRLAVGIVTAGPGIANAVGGLATAFEANTPMLIIAGRNALNLNQMGALQTLDGPRLVRDITKWADTVWDVSRLGEYVDLACRIATSGRPGPVLLEVPSDLMFQVPDAAAREEALRPLVRGLPTPPNPASVEQAAELLVRAKRPLIIAGSGAYWGNAGPGLRRLAHELRLPVFMKGLGRGLVPEDLVTGFPWPLAQITAPKADLVLLVGTRINQTLSYGNPARFDPTATFIQVDVDAGEIGRNHYVDLPVLGDAGHFVNALADALVARGYTPQSDPEWVNEGLVARLQRLGELGRYEQGEIHPIQQARALAERLPANAIVVADGAACLNFFNAELRIQQAPGWIDHSPFGCMGVGVPFAIGAVAAEQDRAASTGATPRPVLLVTGDGSFGFYIAELSTASHHGLPFCCVISNDGAWGANRVNQKRNLGRNYATQLPRCSYEQVAQGFDCYGELVTAPTEIGPSIDRALAAVRDGQVAVLNMLCDQEAPEILRDDPLVSLGGATGNLRNPIGRR